MEEESVQNIFQMRRQTTIRLVAAIAVEILVILAIYFEINGIIKINFYGYTTAGLAVMIIYNSVGKALVEMDRYERAKREMLPLKYVPMEVIRRKAIIYTILAILIPALIIAISYL